MISQTAEYALRAMVHLATRPNQALTTQQIAHHTRVPAGYLSKVLQSLARGGLIQSQRGLYGGFTLARPIHEVNLWEVVNAVDPIRRIKACPLGMEGAGGHGSNLCPLHRRLDDALAQVETVFLATTLAEMVAGAQLDAPLCPGAWREEKEKLASVSGLEEELSP